MAQVPVTEQFVPGAVLYSFMLGTAGTTYDLTMGKVGTLDTWTVEINFWNDGSNLYVKFDCPDATPAPGDSLWLAFGWSYPYRAHVLARGVPDLDGYWDYDTSTWIPDTTHPGHTVDSDDSWETSGGRTIVYGTIPLNGRDTLDLQVPPGRELGLYIGYADATFALYAWPPGSAPYVNYWSGPTDNWGELWTMKVYTAVVPHAADEPGGWIGYLGLMNNGLETATVCFRFYDSAGNEVSEAIWTVPPRAHFGEYVRNIAGVGSFSGSIYITSDEPFSGQLNQHDAGLVSFAIYQFSGEEFFVMYA